MPLPDRYPEHADGDRLLVRVGGPNGRVRDLTERYVACEHADVIDDIEARLTQRLGANRVRRYGPQLVGAVGPRPDDGRVVFLAWFEPAALAARRAL